MISCVHGCATRVFAGVFHASQVLVSYLFTVELGGLNMHKCRLGLRMRPGTSVSGNIKIEHWPPLSYPSPYPSPHLLSITGLELSGWWWHHCNWTYHVSEASSLPCHVLVSWATHSSVEVAGLQCSVVNCLPSRSLHALFLELVYTLLGWAWASPTLVWLHCTHVCVCLLGSCLDQPPLTICHFWF